MGCGDDQLVDEGHGSLSLSLSRSLSVSASVSVSRSLSLSPSLSQPRMTHPASVFFQVGDQSNSGEGL